MGIIIIRKKGIGRCLSYLLEKIEFIANEDLYFAAIFGFSPRSYETYEYFNCKSFKYTITFLCNVWLTILHWIDLHTSAPPSASSSLHDLINLAHVASLKITQQRKLLPPWKSEINWQPSWARRPGTTKLAPLPHCHGNFTRRGEVTANLQANLAEALYCINTPSKLLRWRSKPKQAEYFLRLLRLASLAN